MPLYGTLDVAPLASRAVEMPNLDTDTLVLEKATVMQVMYEIEDAAMLDLLPKALHPTIPPTVTFVFWSVPSSPVGPFCAAQVRIGCRAGARPRGFPIGVFVNSADAAELLGSRWGFTCTASDVSLVRAHHFVEGRVGSALTVRTDDPQPISGGDVQFVANMNLARVAGEPLLVQVDPEYVFSKADKGQPSLVAFDAAACGDARVDPVYPVSASVTVCDITLPVIRYVCDPNVPAMQGTRKTGRA